MLLRRCVPLLFLLAHERKVLGQDDEARASLFGLVHPPLDAREVVLDVALRVELNDRRDQRLHTNGDLSGGHAFAVFSGLASPFSFFFV